MIKLSQTQKQELLKNPNVEKITEKQVIYTSKFKQQAVKAFLDGDHPKLIFKKAGINPSFFIKKYCQSCLKRWKNKYLEEGAESLNHDNRGINATGRPKKENLDDLSYEELQAIIEIQWGVIEELKKKRALAKKKY